MRRIGIMTCASAPDNRGGREAAKPA
jgi:hypothetical protein